MVRARVVSHPSMWPFCGYNEIQSPRKKNVLIDHEKLRVLVGIRSYDSMRLHHKGWIDEYLGSQETGCDDKWTRSIAVGSKGFVEKVRSILFGLVKGRKVKESGDGYQLREPSAPYRVDVEAENEDIGLENTHFWKSFADQSVCYRGPIIVARPHSTFEAREISTFQAINLIDNLKYVPQNLTYKLITIRVLQN